MGTEETKDGFFFIKVDCIWVGEGQPSPLSCGNALAV
jgi:hypothetical protein